MADDGSGSDISIPSFLMFKHDADKVKERLMDDQPVQLEMSWSLPNPDDRVEYDLWSTPTDVVSKQFLTEFKPISKALGDRAYFTPHMYIYDGVKTHCQGNDGENFCYNLCTNNGRYCATDPDNDLDQGISGADVVKESLRRLCIWKHYGESDGVGETWWNYVEEFMERCNTADYFMNEDCVKDCYKHAKVDGEKVDRCMSDSGGLTKDAPNAFLDLEILHKRNVALLFYQQRLSIPPRCVDNSVRQVSLTLSALDFPKEQDLSYVISVLDVPILLHAYRRVEDVQLVMDRHRPDKFLPTHSDLQFSSWHLLSLVSDTGITIKLVMI
jgi:hypothetical protein